MSIGCSHHVFHYICESVYMYMCQPLLYHVFMCVFCLTDILSLAFFCWYSVVLPEDRRRGRRVHRLPHFGAQLSARVGPNSL